MSKIPRDFHFVFGLKEQKEPFHIAYYLCLESCLRINRPDRLFFYYHHKPYGRYWNLIRHKIELIHVPLNELVSRATYTRRVIGKEWRYAHHADFIRLEKLLKHGGVYADIDTLFLRPIPDSLYEKSFVLGREDDIVDPLSGQLRKSLCNAFIMSEPGAPFARTWIERMPGAMNGTWSNHSCQLAYELSEEFPSEIHIEESTAFYPYMWTNEDLHALLEMPGGEWHGAYSVHLWSHLWWAKKRREHVDFHGAQLTEDFIRYTDTTYNTAARPFLPPERWSAKMKRYMRDKLSLFFPDSSAPTIVP